MVATRYFRLVLIACISFAMNSGNVDAKDDAVSFDRLVPADSFMFVSVPSLEHLKTQLLKSSYGKLINDESLGDVRKEVVKAIDDAIDEFADDLGVDSDDLFKLPTGGAAIALIAPEPRSMAAIGIVNVAENDATDAMLELLDDLLKDEGFEQSSEEIDGVDVVVHSREGKSPFGEKQITFAYCITDGMWIFGSSVAALESVLLRADGENDDVLAENEQYQHILKKCEAKDAKPVSSFYMDLVSLIERQIKNTSEPFSPGMLALSFFPKLGIDKFQAIGGSYFLADGDFEMSYRVFAIFDEPITGVWNALQFPPVDQTPPAWIPEDSGIYAAINWDVQKAYTAVESLVDEFQGAGTVAKFIEKTANHENGPKIHIKRDLIDQLSGPIHLLMNPVVSKDGDVELEEDEFHVCFGFEVKDHDQMQRVMDMGAKTTGFPGKAREFRGHTIYEMPDTGAPRRLGFGLIDKTLIISTDISLIERAARETSREDSLAESSVFKSLSKHMPTRTSGISFNSGETDMKPLYKLLRSKEFADDVGIDLSALPEFDAIRKYFPREAAYAVPDDGGVLFVQFAVSESEDD